jgi:alpha-1,2-mannosyltransferase
MRAHLERLGLAVIALVVLRVALRSQHVQWDLRAYHAAARAALAGLEPYSLADLTAAAGRPISLPFVYPPVGLVPFLPLAPLPFAAAGAVWLLLKLACLVTLVETFRRVFLPRTERLWIALVAVFGGSAAAIWDLRSGNVALIETTLWVAGLAAFARGRDGRAALLFALAALWKGWPAVFLLLLLAPREAGTARRRAALAGVAALAVAALLALPLLGGWGAAYARLLATMPMPFPTGDSNPSALAVFESAARRFGAPAGGPAPGAWAAFGAWVLVVLAGALPLVRRARARGDRRLLALVAALGVTLLSPRPMAYGWTGAALAALALAPPPFHGPAGRAALATLLAAQGLASAALQPWGGFVAEAGPPLALLAVWILAGAAALAAGRAADDPAAAARTA